MRNEKQPTTLTNTSDNNGTIQTTTTLRSHPVVASSSVLVKPLPPTPVKRVRRPLKDDDDDDDDDSKDFYGFRRYDFRFASVKDDDEEKKKTKRTKEQNHLNTCWETNELAQCARDISIATFASEAASDDDDFLYETAPYMNTALIANGHDSRFLTFTKSGNAVGTPVMSIL